MAEQPALNRFYVASYAANDKDFPILAVRLDPRVAGYRVPEDLSPHPDSKRYPNHVFTGSQPSNGDERVTHVYEILPSPWVPFTRYDDDLGPIQGRRRSVKNEGQQADLAADKKISYEGREGSAIVSNEIEETWSIETDDDGNSLFPIKDRDFYDPSRGAVQERRQLFVPTGEEEGTLENINGVITQTSYEPYNEFLSVKIVQTYKVDGPQLIGRATDNDGQLVTVTTQRKGALDYIPPNPTATRTVEINREDAESLVERIVDTPEIFTAQTFQVERPDPIPQKFRVAVPIRSSQEVVEGEAELPTLSEGEISRNEEQRNKFLKRVSATSRDQTVLPQTLLQKATDNDRQEVTITETLQVGDTDEVATATTTVESEALGDGNYVVRKTEVPEVFGSEVFRKTREDITPQKFKAAQEDSTIEENVAGTANPNISLGTGEFAKSEQQVNKFVKRVSTTSRAITESVTLLEKVLTQDGQIGSRILTLASGDQSFVPSALLVDANVEALGDGRTVKSETTVPTVFAGKTIQKSRIDLTPEKFRAAQEDTTVEETIAGTINPNISLGAGEFRKSEQQVTQFVKRISSNTRDISASTDLTEVVITNQGQIATRTLRLSADPQSIQPDALLVDGSIEALGDGRTIKTEVRVPSVFDAKVLSATKPDTVPEKFRVNAPNKRTEEIIPQAQANDPNLSIDEYSKSEQRITEFTVQKTTVTREDNLNEVLNQRLEENWGINIPFREYIAPEIPTAPNIEGEGISDTQHIIREYDSEQLDSTLSAFSVTIPTSIDLDLPRILKNITVVWQKEKSTSVSDFDGNGLLGAFKSLTQQDDGEVVSSLSLVPKIQIDFEDVWGKNIPATIHLFFLKKEDLTTPNILSKVNAINSWPVFKPKSLSTTVYGKSETRSLRSYISRAVQLNDTAVGFGYVPSKGSKEASSASLIPVSINIPPCLTPSRNISSSETLSNGPLNISLNYETITAIVGGSSITFPAPNINKNLSHTINANVSFPVPATNFADVPKSGTYLINSSAEPYKFGWFLVRATTFNASVFA